MSTTENFEISVDDEILLRHRQRLATMNQYPPPRTTLCAGVLLLMGIILLTTGLVIFFGPGSDRGLPILILGAIMFIPGIYSSYVLYGAWRGWQGFDFSMVPSYDD